MSLLAYSKVWSPPQQRPDQRGMSLIEVTIALAIMALAGVAFLAGMTTMFKGVLVSQNSVTLESLAKMELEYVKGVEYTNADWNYQLPSNPPSSNPPSWDPTHSLPPGYDGYTVQVEAERLPDHDPDDGLQKITVTVSHIVDSAGNKTVLTVSGYKVKPQ
jgi:prepilin-type N-terminal cleavage/methylation domain-containing protein